VSLRRVKEMFIGIGAQNPNVTFGL
jgi:hypothetical protein